MKGWPRAVLFDFDGVIVNSEPLHFLAFQGVLAEEGIQLSEDEYWDDLIGFDDRGSFERVYKNRGQTLPPKTFLSLMASKSRVMMDLIHRDGFRQRHTLRGVEAFVRGLWRERPLAICSGGLRDEIEAMLEGISLRDCFGVIVAAEDVKVGKPDPEGYFLAMQQVGEKLKKTLKPADCLVVEDAPTVIRTVKQAGFPVLGVATSYPIAKLADADWAVETLDPAEVRRAVPQLPWGE